ncbi:MAG: hypothetical protein KHX29_07975 [Prevotella buccalis]|nr:hypothetical protein [Hoylesella buccalis]
MLTLKALDKHGYPPGFDDMRKWNDTIQKMADAFELMKPAGATHLRTRSKQSGKDLICSVSIFAIYGINNKAKPI